MRAVGLGALQQRHMLELGRHGLERLKQILQHPQIRFHLVPLTPALDHPGLFVQRGIDNMGHIVHLAEDLGTTGLVLQVNGDERRPLKAVGNPT